MNDKGKQNKKIVAWFSGGITSAITSKLCINKYGGENVRIIFIDTKNESKDTYRFLKDCEKWYGIKIERLTNKEYSSIEEVWYKFKGLNFANGAICSSELKRTVRQRFQKDKDNEFDGQAFGFDYTKRELNRAKALELNYPESKPIFPLIEERYTKEDCIRKIKEVGIALPLTYIYGFRNNNCFRTGCVQGGIGYWQKMKREFSEKFEYMARIEHNITDKKGKPVTMLRDQKTKKHIFLRPHFNYPEELDISMKKGREPKPLKECNGFCGINDLTERNETEKEINFDNT